VIPGSPNGLVDAGDALAQAASNLDATRTSIVRQARLVDDGWTGAASAGAGGALAQAAAHAGAGGAVCRRASAVLEVYAAELRAAQQQYEVAAREMATGQSQQNALVVRIQALTSELTLLPAPATAWGPLQPCPTPSSPREAVKHDGGLLSSIGHGVLDVVGLVPVLGAPADGANAAWYAADGDTLNAGLSAAGMVPFLGWGATGTKIGIKGFKAARAVEETGLAGKGVKDAAKAAQEMYPRAKTFRRGVRDQVWNQGRQDATGQVRDPLTGRFMSKNEPWDMGHQL